MDPQRVRIYQTEALVLRQQDYAEADRILTLLTPQGRLRAVAKGARRSTSHKAGHLDLFMRVELQLARGRNLDIITQAECKESFDNLRLDILRFTFACYAAELFDYIIQEEEQRELYQLAVDTLRRMDSAHNLAVWARYLDMTLLGLAGFQPNLYQCVRCRRDIQPEVNYLSLDLGGLLCPACNTGKALQVSINTQKLLRFLQRSQAADVARLSVSADTLQEAENLMLLYWQHVLEREIKSSANLRQLRAESVESVQLVARQEPNQE